MKLIEIASVIVAVSAAAFAADGVTIYPIDQAAIAADARFDFKVEFPEVLAESDFEIRVGGKPAGEALGSAGKLITEKFESPPPPEDPRKKMPLQIASAFIARACSIHAAQNALLIEVFVRKEKVAEVTWRVFLPRSEGRPAKNVILMLGDGLSQAHRTAARILSKGMKQGKYNGTLAMDDMPQMGLIGTSGMESIITDSANSASAYTTGHKSANGALGVYKDRTDRYDSVPDDVTDDPACESIASFARRMRNMAVGIVTDAEIQDATPAAMYSHVADRSQFSLITDMLEESHFEVILGGGRKSIKPAHMAAFKEQGYTLVETRTELLNVATPKKLFGIFNPGNIDGVWDRKFLKNPTPANETDQPDLTEMAAAALKVLDPSPAGFVLLIEGARIDKFSHNLDWERAVMDTIMFDHTVALVQDYAKRRGDTLVIVLGDHTHGVSVVGTIEISKPHDIDIGVINKETGEMEKKTVPKQGRDYVRTQGDAGFPDYKIKDGYPESLNVKRRLAVFFTNFPDYYEIFNPKFGGEYKPSVRMATEKGEFFSVTNESYKGHPEAMLRTGNLPRGTNYGVHSCEDSIVTAMGPGSEAIHGFLDNTKIFEIMANALNLNATAK